MNRLTLLLVLLFSITSLEALGQVTIAPTNIFISDNSKFGTYMVINGSNEPQEIAIEFFFGYSTTDKEGNRANITGDSLMTAKHSITQNVRAFPQNFVLAPNQRQIVRLRITGNTRELNDGTYWSRVKTSSNPETQQVEVGTTSDVSARVAIKIEQVTGLFYTVGTTTTGIEVQEVRTSLGDNNILTVLTDYKRTGNSPFLGSISTTLINSSNQEVKQAFVSTSVYFDGTNRQTLDLTGLPTGEYKIKVQFESQRGDVSSSDLVQMKTVTKTIPYVIR